MVPPPEHAAHWKGPFKAVRAARKTPTATNVANTETRASRVCACKIIVQITQEGNKQISRRIALQASLIV